MSLLVGGVLWLYEFSARGEQTVHHLGKTNMKSTGSSWRNGKANAKFFCKCTGSRKAAEENAALLSGVGNQMAKDMQMSEVLSVFLISLFTGKVCLLDSCPQAY